jgi:ATP-dependent RNA helicase SUPV3L1/SUV3
LQTVTDRSILGAIMRPPVLALLGPTNTGKTHLAVLRMLEHRSGMMGFPLRLLARENYDRVVALRGAESVALITGEERIVPKHPAYFVCTVEAMPLDRRVEFLAVDEIQLAADRERGHVFTDRLLYARGTLQTMFLGADTIRPLLKELLPEAEVTTRPRLSTLRYALPKKLGRLPRRSAIVVFSVADLYLLAERIRRESGGAALVFGALSPRARNAQVGLYQNGDVDFLVATDAIGMGLNLDIDHVAFTALSKFDGRGPRALRPAEVAQIAGRAGRHVKDGTFGATGELGPFPRPLVEAIESHRFDPLTSIFWRNPDLNFATPPSLLHTLARRPPHARLIRMKEADDHRALEALAGDPEIAALARGPEAVERLWEVCQVPDFRNVMTEAHTRLLGQIYRFLSGPPHRLPEDWVAGQVAALDRTEGDTDTLLARIAGIRTWTYVSNRSGWLVDPAHWQLRTREIEDRLSDTLHERLTERFVDRRAAIVARHAPGELLVEGTPDGEVTVQGLRAGRLEGFHFVSEPGARESARGLVAAANRALREDIGARVAELEEAPAAHLSLRPSGEIHWRGVALARLRPGDDALQPRVELRPAELLDPKMKERVRRRLASWLDEHVRRELAPIVELREAPVTGAARGLVFVLLQSLGTTRRRRVSAQIASLTPADRRTLAQLSVTIGREAVFVSSAMGAAALELRALLYSVRMEHPFAPLPWTRPSVALDPSTGTDSYLAAGFVPIGARAIRADRLERAIGLAHRHAARGPFVPGPDLASLLGCPVREQPPLLAALGLVAGPENTMTLRTRRAAHG